MAAEGPSSPTADASTPWTDESPQALVVVQAFPPLLKNAGGVAKRYITLCRALIDQLGWRVTLLTPVDVTVTSPNRSSEAPGLSRLRRALLRIGRTVFHHRFSFLRVPLQFSGR